MIRFILRTDDASMPANVGGSVLTSYRTIDFDCPALEKAMRAGGQNFDGTFSHTQLVGAEVLPGDAA